MSTAFLFSPKAARRRVCRVIACLLVMLVLVPSLGWAARGDCGQPLSNGATPTATDCLFILKSAVGLTTCVPACICDLDQNGSSSASDALRCLWKAVGRPVTLVCCAGATTSTTASTSTTSTTAPTTTTTATTTTTMLPTTTSTLGTTTSTTTTMPPTDTRVFDSACITVAINAGSMGGQTTEEMGTITMEVDLSSVGDSDGDGLDEAIVEFTDLLVTSQQGSFGTITVSLNSDIHPAIDQRSVGVLEETTNATPGILDLPPYAPSGTANMTIDLYLQAVVNGLFISGRGHNDVPITLVGTLSGNPPAPGDLLSMQNAQDVPLLRDDDTTWVVFGNTIIIPAGGGATVELNAVTCP